MAISRAICHFVLIQWTNCALKLVCASLLSKYKYILKSSVRKKKMQFCHKVFYNAYKHFQRLCSWRLHSLTKQKKSIWYIFLLFSVQFCKWKISKNSWEQHNSGKFKGELKTSKNFSLSWICKFYPIQTTIYNTGEKNYSCKSRFLLAVLL